MPHKYEREIEEILRNMELGEPRRGVSERIHAGERPVNRPRVRGPSMKVRLSSSELLLLLGVLLALGAVCLAYYYRPDLISGILAFAAFAAIVGGLVVGWMSAARPTYPPVWRSSNVVEMRPRRRGPFTDLVTQMRILRLKMRYWRMRNR